MGGGIFGVDYPEQSGLMKIINNTFSGNQADEAGGLLLLDQKNIILNTICWGNNALFAPEIMLHSGVLTIAYSDIEPDSMQILDGTLNQLSGNIRPLPASTPPDMGAWESDVLNSLQGSASLSFPNSFTLRQNYPNPFNPTTTIEFQISNPEFVTLKIYNMLGQEIATPVSGKMKAGNYKYTWNGGGLASGLYLYKLRAGDFVQMHKMLLLK